MAYVSKDDMVEIFLDTEQYCKTDENLKQAVAESIKGTRFYAAEDYPPLPEKRFKKTIVTVVKRRTFDAAISMQRKYLELRIAVHNFPSRFAGAGGGSLPLLDALSRAQHRR